MAEVILVTGGCRSGKSAFAEKLVREADSENRFYIATCPVVDAEMAERVRRHQERRAADRWITIEEETDLVSALRRCTAGSAVLVDCLTLWISNLMYAADQKNRLFGEDEMRAECERFQAACAAFDGTIVLVLNEVGLGIVPENEIARRFRDCSGRCGQMIASFADRVYLTVCGIPMKLKG